MSELTTHTTSKVIHAAAGWLRVACMEGAAPVGTYSTIKNADVTCPECKALQSHDTDETVTGESK